MIPGQATITATTKDGAKTATCRVTVNKPVVPVTSVTVTPAEKKVSEGETFTLTAGVLPADATNKEVTWSSSAKEVAEVSAQGEVRAIKAGKATITVRTADGGKTATCEVTVEKPVVAVERVVVDLTEKTLLPGETFVLKATVEPMEATNKAVTWDSSEKSVAIVNEKGEVRALTPGQTTITVTTKDGAKTATCHVTVKKPVVRVTSVSVNPANKVVFVNETFTITATVLPTDATERGVTWTTSDQTIATVSEAGEVRALAPGRVTITATTKDGAKMATCRAEVKVKTTEEYKTLLAEAKKRLEASLSALTTELSDLKKSPKTVNEKLTAIDALIAKITLLQVDVLALDKEVKAKEKVLLPQELAELKEKANGLTTAVTPLLKDAEAYKAKLDKAVKSGKGFISDIEVIEL